MCTALRVFLAFLFSVLSICLTSAIAIGLSLVLLGTDDPGKSGVAAGQYDMSYAFLLVPVIIVACFRSQYLKRKRLYAVVKTLFFSLNTGSIMIRNTYVVFMIFSFVTVPLIWFFAWDLIEPMTQPLLTFGYISTTVVTVSLNIVALLLILSPSARSWIKGSPVP